MTKKTIFGLIFLFVLLISFRSKDKTKAKDIIGIWEYQFSNVNDINSKVNDINFKIPHDKICPVQTLTFLHCNDKIELKGMPDYVLKRRKGDFFQNIKCETAIDNIKIDVYYPSSAQNGKIISVLNYGVKLKSMYKIEKLNADTLIISNGRCYNIEGEIHSGIRHIYTKIKS